MIVHVYYALCTRRHVQVHAYAFGVWKLSNLDGLFFTTFLLEYFECDQFEFRKWVLLKLHKYLSNRAPLLIPNKYI